MQRFFVAAVCSQEARSSPPPLCFETFMWQVSAAGEPATASLGSFLQRMLFLLSHPDVAKLVLAASRKADGGAAKAQNLMSPLAGKRKRPEPDIDAPPDFQTPQVNSSAANFPCPGHFFLCMSTRVHNQQHVKEYLQAGSSRRRVSTFMPPEPVVETGPSKGNVRGIAGLPNAQEGQVRSCCAWNPDSIQL